MKFRVLPPTKKVPVGSKAGLYLVQDNWNDYGFQTQYHLYLISESKETYIGALKVLRRGQTGAHRLQIAGDFDQLDEDFVSIGQSLDYYQRLGEMGSRRRDTILRSLRDAAKRPDLEKEFRSEVGWGKSLFRDQQESQIQEFLTLARALVSGDYTSVPSDDFQFSFKPNGWVAPLRFDFTSVELPPSGWVNTRPPLPGRIVALIGRNGSGKSTLLARLARVAYGSVQQRADGVFAELGQIEPVGIGFPRIIAFSYSAFDSFVLPGVAPNREDEPDERLQIVEDLRSGEGRFIFCGLRDIATEFEDAIKRQADNPQPISDDRVYETRLKSIATLADEFGRTVRLIVARRRESLFSKCLTTLLSDPSFSQWNDVETLRALLVQSPEAAYLNWSTGHKVCVQIIANLCAYVSPRSLVLIDEPEMHLHPPLLAVLMHAVRHVLRRQKAFCIVATHSPVVLQETLARDVHVVRREGELAGASQPAVETFAENVGTLTSEVFGLNTEVTDYHRVLDSLISEIGEVDQIDQLFGQRGLSRQGLAYVMSRLKGKGN